MSNLYPNINAASLRKASSKTAAVKDITTDLLRLVYQEIEKGHANHQDSCTFKVPSNFDIQGMSNRRAQMLIYNDAMNDIERRGFIVRMDKTLKYWTIYWKIEIDDELENHLLQRLASRIHEDERTTVRGNSSAYTDKSRSVQQQQREVQARSTHSTNTATRLRKKYNNDVEV